MRTTLDALRSLKRYASLVLGEDWEVRLDRGEGVITLPFCRVSKVGALLITGPSWETTDTQAFALHCTLPPEDSSEEAFVAALDAENTLHQGFRIGVGEGGPFRVPLYDYDGVTLTAGSNERSYCDYMRVRDLSITQVPDPNDDRRVSVACDIRLTWRRSGRLPAGNNVVDTVTSGPKIVGGVFVEPG